MDQAPGGYNPPELSSRGLGGRLSNTPSRSVDGTLPALLVRRGLVDVLRHYAKFPTPEPVPGMIGRRRLDGSRRQDAQKATDDLLGQFVPGPVPQPLPVGSPDGLAREPVSVVSTHKVFTPFVSAGFLTVWTRSRTSTAPMLIRFLNLSNQERDHENGTLQGALCESR